MSPGLLGEELQRFFTVTGDKLKIEPAAAGQSQKVVEPQLGVGGLSQVMLPPAACPSGGKPHALHTGGRPATGSLSPATSASSVIRPGRGHGPGCGGTGAALLSPGLKDRVPITPPTRSGLKPLGREMGCSAAQEGCQF